MNAEEELRAALERVGQALDRLHVPWAIGGSFASTIHGEPRTTNDIDVIANLRLPHVTAFKDALGNDFYTDEQSMREAISARDSFNVIDERSFLKIDVFVPTEGPLGAAQLVRRRSYALSDVGPVVWVLGPEDTALQKLRWYKIGGGVSDRQWRDVLGVLRLNRDLDLDYMHEASASGNLGELLVRALSECGR